MNVKAGDALSEGFNKELADKIEEARKEAEAKGKKLVVIGLENPPYLEVSGSNLKKHALKVENNDFVTERMIKENVNKKASKGQVVTRDLANKFIWSGFKYYFDYYVVYSPIKYWKSQHLVDKTLLEGTIADRSDFHATEGGISIISWKNEDTDNEELVLENVTVKKINKSINELFSYKKKDDGEDVCYLLAQGVPSFQTCILSNDRSFSMIKTNRGGFINVDDDKFKKILPLFAANCYTCKDYTEKEVIMKSGDGGTAYQNDNEFLEDCFIWCCLTDKNKCWSGA